MVFVTEKYEDDRHETRKIVEIVPEPYSIERVLLANGVEYTLTFVLKRERVSDVVLMTYERRFGIGKDSRLEFTGGQNLPNDESARMRHLRQKSVKAIHSFEDEVRRYFP